MIVKIALRNVVRNTRRSLTIGAFVAVAIALLFAGNALFDGTDQGIHRAFIDSFTADLSIAPSSKQNLSIFGDQTPVIGEFTESPVISPYKDVFAWLSKSTEIRAVTPVASGLLLLEINDYKTPVPVFGIEPDSYFTVFPAIHIVSGGLLKNGEAGIMITSSRAKQIEAATKRTLHIGDVVTLSVVTGSGFQIRPVPLRGIYAYGSSDQTLDAITLVDANTIKTMYGLTIGNIEKLTQDDSKDDSSFDFNSMFDNNGDVTAPRSAGITQSDVEKRLAETADRDRFMRADTGAWNFLLLRLADEKKQQSVVGEIRSQARSANWDLVVRDWRGTAGSAAQYVYWMRVIFNVGFVIVLLTGIMIVINTLLIGIRERTSEIGAMRAIGAAKSFIRKLFIIETFALVAGFGVLGVALGSLLVLLVGATGISLNNPFLETLFGVPVLHPEISIENVLLHLAICVLVALVSWIFPVRFALSVRPINAITIG